MQTQSILGFEDPIDSWTHLLGALGVCVLLIRLFTRRDERRHPIPILIYGFSCIFLFTMSGVYHLLPRDIPARYVLRILDHAGIFVLIAGTLIALHLILFSGLMKWGVIIVASVIAALGITFGAIYFSDIPDYMTHAIFIAFGWLGVVSIVGLWKLKKTVPAKYLIYGGVAYTVGAIIDLINYPVIIPGVLGAHELFHFSVLMGVTFHWFLILESIKTVQYKDRD
ncbi:MAG: hemolysin III family protein [Cyclobacteriaceae bacterium]|nr:hemolysin III family protein [Cyclobacteriaceae bacterium]